MSHIPRQGVILGIDPGSTNMGVCALVVDMVEGDLLFAETFNLNGTQLAREFDHISHIHPDSTLRLMGLENRLYQIFCHYKPFTVVSEDAYYKPGRVVPFRVLVECIDRIRLALYRYNDHTELFLIKPSTAKNAIGVHGHSGKDPIVDGLLKIPTFARLQLSEMTEHEHDACAIAYCQYLTIRSRLWPSLLFR
jgi:Holliday junction resolvasome RuvABC endonuclease subunit